MINILDQVVCSWRRLWKEEVRRNFDHVDANVSWIRYSSMSRETACLECASTLQEFRFKLGCYFVANLLEFAADLLLEEFSKVPGGVETGVGC